MNTRHHRFFVNITYRNVGTSSCSYNPGQRRRLEALSRRICFDLADIRGLESIYLTRNGSVGHI